MPATWKTIEDIVIGVLQAAATRYGLKCPTLTGDICPMQDIDGLDSLHCVEIIVDIAALVPIETDNSVFWTENGSLRTIQQVAKHLASKQRSP
jgi:hypothetical protein